jgi:ribosome maturation factor RimP
MIRGPKDNLVVEVFIDGDQGVDTASCAVISRALGKDLDAGMLKDAPYTLTVSSPGLDRPLKFPRQYPKHVGRGITLRYRSGGSVERLSGVLAGADERSVRVSAGTKGDEKEIPFDDIVEARIEPRW